MNVLMLAPEFYPVWGGAGAYVTELAQNLPPSVTYHVLTPRRLRFRQQIIEPEEVTRMFPDNVHVHYLGEARNRFFDYFSFQLRCRRIIPSLVKKWDINLIHSQSAMPDLFVSPDRLPIPILTTIHTTIEGQVKATRSSGGSFFRLDSSERATLLLSPILTFLENRYYEEDRYFITVSEWAKNEFVKEKGIDADKIAVIHNGVDPERFSSVTKRKAEPRFSELADISYPKVLYFSRLIDKKGINFLMKAIPNVLERCDAHFVFAGTGREIHLDVPRENYTYLGYVEEINKPYLYALADIFILPSLYENLPISILEAMASGNAVIATSVGGIPELIKHRENGLLIQPKSDADIVEAVTTLVEDEGLRERLVVNAKTTVATNFTTKSAVAKTLSYYAEVLARYGGRHRPR